MENVDTFECTCLCGKPGEEEHTCPFAEDINNDHESLCNCCAECSYACWAGI